MDQIPLKDFISGTLINIAQGIRDANETVKDFGAGSKPFQLEVSTGGHGKTKKGVKFSVAVNVTKGDSDKAGIGVMSVFLGGGIQGASERSNEIAHRIEFEIAVDSYLD